MCYYVQWFLLRGKTNDFPCVPATDAYGNMGCVSKEWRRLIFNTLIPLVFAHIINGQWFGYGFSGFSSSIIFILLLATKQLGRLINPIVHKSIEIDKTKMFWQIKCSFFSEMTHGIIFIHVIWTHKLQMNLTESLDRVQYCLRYSLVAWRNRRCTVFVKHQYFWLRSQVISSLFFSSYVSEVDIQTLHLQNTKRLRNITESNTALLTQHFKE